MRRLIVFAFVLAIVFFVAMGLCVWITGLSVAAGATFFGIGVAAAVGWVGTSVATNMIAESPLPKGYRITNEDILGRSPKQLVDILTEGFVKQWRSVSETHSRFTENGYHSEARYSTRDGKSIKVVNMCVDDFGNEIKEINNVVGKAHATSLPGIFSVSFFPGIVEQLVLHEAGDGFILLSNRDRTSAWLMHDTQIEKIIADKLEVYRQKFREIVATPNYVDHKLPGVFMN